MSEYMQVYGIYCAISCMYPEYETATQLYIKPSMAF